MQYFLDGIKKTFTVEGRATRTEYWFFVLSVWICSVVLFGIFTSITYLLSCLFPDGGGLATAIMIIIGLAYIVCVVGLVISSFTIQIRRLHDINKSGAWIFLSFVPFIGNIVLLVFCVMPSVTENNNY